MSYYVYQNRNNGTFKVSEAPDPTIANRGAWRTVTDQTETGAVSAIAAYEADKSAASSVTTTKQATARAAIDAAQTPLTGTATLDFPSIAAGATAELTITVTGAAVGDAVIPVPPASLAAGLVATARVTAANTVTVRLANVTSGAIDPASASWKARVLK